MTNAELIALLQRVSGIVESAAWEHNDGHLRTAAVDLDDLIKKLEQAEPTIPANPWTGDRVRNQDSHRVHAVNPDTWDTDNLWHKAHEPVIRGVTVCRNHFVTTRDTALGQNPETMRQLDLDYAHFYPRTDKPITCGTCIAKLRKLGYTIS